MYYILQTRWTGTITPRLILNAGMSISHLDYNDLYVNPDLNQMFGVQAWYADTTAVDLTSLRRFAPRSNQYFQSTWNFFTASGAFRGRWGGLRDMRSSKDPGLEPKE